MTADQQAAEERARSAAQAGRLHDQFAIDPNAPLAEFTTASAQAFATVDLLNPGRLLFALICEPDLPMRMVARERLGQTSLPGLMQIIDHGVLDWPPRRRRCEAIVYPRPQGGAIGASYGHSGRTVPEHAISRWIAPPIAQALRALDSLAIAHRAIRLDNMFFIDKGHVELVLGDCTAGPAGFNQPVLYEPIERALASPGGRGEGSVTDDLYAFGVCLAILLIGDNPLANLADEEILMARMERGSYSTLCERQRIPLAMIEPLRGLLCDDAEGRWDLDKLNRWLKGQRLDPAHPPPPSRPSSPFLFAGRQHWSLRTLAHSLPSDVPGAAAIVRNGHIENWLRLRTKSGEMVNAIAHEAALANGRKGASGSDDALVARVAMMLDPEAPIRYRRLRFLPDGLGPELALAWLENGDAQSPGEVLALNLPGQWLAAKPKSITDLAMLRKIYTRLNAFIDNRSLGYGFERCLYETNPGFPCQSPLVRNAHVISLEMLLPALEDAAATADIGSIPMDRHLAAFVAARWNEGVQPHLAALADPRPEGVIVGTIGIFAALQRRYDLPPLPRLSQWVGGRLNVVVETYHGRATRANLEHKLQSVCREGRFPELYNLVIDGNRRTSDVKGYTAAVKEFAAIRAQINALEANDPQTAGRVREDDQRLAATLSVLASGFAAYVVVVSYLL